MRSWQGGDGLWKPCRTTVNYAPEALVPFIIAAIPETTTAIVGTFTVAQALAYTAFVAAAVGIQYALASSAQSIAPTTGASQILIKQATPPRFRSYGTVKIAGASAFEKTGPGGRFGPDQNIAGNFWIVMIQGQGQIDSVLEHWLQDRQVIFGSSVTIPPETPMTTTAGIAGGYNIATIENKLGGKNQTAHATLVSTFPTVYTSDHRWRGVPTTLLECGHASDTASALQIYPSGPLKYRCIQRAALVYDPRQAGQIADGDPDDPRSAGWTWSDNAALVLLDFLRHPDGWARRSNRRMLPMAKFNVADWVAFANLCDENVALYVAGTVKRYRISGTYQLTDPPKAILQRMLDTCDAELYRHGDGTIGIRGGQWSVSTLTLSDADILSHTLAAGSKKASACNIVTAKYTSPAHDYQPQDMDPFLDRDNIDLRGEELTTALDLTWCPSHAQARRLSKIQMAKRNPDWAGSIIAGPRGLLAFNQRIVTLQISELAVAETFMVTGFEPSADLKQVKITLGSLDRSAYDWVAVEEGFPPALTALDIDDATVPLPRGVAVSFSTVPNGRIASVTWGVNNPIGYMLNYEAQYYELPGGAPILMRVSEAARAAVTKEVLSLSALYRFQVRAISPGGQPSPWHYLPPKLDAREPEATEYRMLGWLS